MSLSPHQDPTPQPHGDATGVTLLEHMTTQLVGVDRRITELRVAIETQLEERNHRYQQRFEAQTQALDAALASAKEAVQTALTAAEKATTKAEVSADKRFAAVNEFREQLADQAGTFMPRSEAETRLASLAEKIADLRTYQDTLTGHSTGSRVEQRLQDIATLAAAQGAHQSTASGKDAGVHASWGFFVGAVGAAAALAAVIARLSG